MFVLVEYAPVILVITFSNFVEGVCNESSTVFIKYLFVLIIKIEIEVVKTPLTLSLDIVVAVVKKTNFEDTLEIVMMALKVGNFDENVVEISSYH